MSFLHFVSNNACIDKIVFCYCLIGIFGRSLLVLLHNPRQRLCLLLRTYISHHQTSEQEGRWSCRSYSRRSQGNHITWSKRWSGSAAGDWSYNWSKVVSHRDECPEDDDRHHRLLHDILEFPHYSKFAPTNRGQLCSSMQLFNINNIIIALPVLYDYYRMYDFYSCLSVCLFCTCCLFVCLFIW